MQFGVSIAASPVRIAPKSICSDKIIIDFLMGKYCDSLPVCLSGGMRHLKRDLLAGNYVQADETPIGVQTPDKHGETHRAYFWQYSRRGFIEALKCSKKRMRPAVSWSAWSCSWMDFLRLNGIRSPRAESVTRRPPCPAADYAPWILAELHVLPQAMKESDLILPQSVKGKATAYTLKRWTELTVFRQHPEVELSTNLAENSMRLDCFGTP